MTIDRIKRTKEIEKAIEMVGMVGVLSRLKTQEDREIFEEIAQRMEIWIREKEEEALKRAGISF